MNFAEYRRARLGYNGIALAGRHEVGLAFGGDFVELEFTHVYIRWAQRQRKNPQVTSRDSDWVPKERGTRAKSYMW